MNAHYRLKTLITLSMAVFLLVGCAARQAFKRGAQAEVARDYDTALEQYRQALAAEPGNVEYRLKFEQTRYTAAFEHFQRGRRALEAGDPSLARAEFQRAVEIDPTHDFARQELLQVERLLANRAESKAEPILDFEELMESTRTDANLGSQMRTNLTQRINLRMAAPPRTIFENLGAQAGFQVIFGPGYRGTQAPIELQDVNIFEALDLVSLQTRSFWQPVNETTILVMDDNQQNRRDYEEHVLKTVYMTNVTSTNDLNQILNVLRTALGLRGVFQFEPGNAIVIHDTPARVAMIERVLRALDKAKAEIVVEATIMEVDRNTLQDLGILPPADSVVGFNPPGVTAGPDASNSASIRGLSQVNSGSFSVSISDSIARFLATKGSARLLQNPRIRTTEGVTASLLIGSEVPVPTTSVQSTNFGGAATTAYTYQRVGVQLDIVSKVLLNREVSLQVTVQVKALAGDRAVGELLIPVLSSRIVAHTIRLAEGETNILGGIISETETQTVTGIPGLKDVPVLRYLFGQERTTRDQAEVIIMLTPHIVRMPNITEEDVRGVFIGGEANLRLRPSYESPAPLPIPATPTPAPAQPASATPAAPVAPPAPTTVALTFAPAPVALAAEGETAVNVAINGPNILGTELTLAYDPSAFKIRDVRDGGFLSRDGQVVALVHNIDNQRGTARVTLERAPNAPLVSGNGTLLTLLLEPGERKGASTLRVTDFGVRDARQALHPGSSTEVQITVP